MLKAVCLKEISLWLLKDDFPSKTFFFLMLVESLGDDPQKVTPNRHSAPPDQTLLRTEVAWRQDGATFLHKQKSLFVTQKFKEPTRQLVILVVVIVDF